MRKLSTELHFLCKQPAKAMSKPIGKLTNVDLFSFVLFDNIHTVLNLIIQVIYDAIL